MECHRETFNAHADEHPLKSTLGNERWMRENEERIKALFPMNGILLTAHAFREIANGFIKLGVAINTQMDMTRTLVYLQRIGVLQSDTHNALRPTPYSIFDRQETPDDFYRIKTKRA